MSERIVFLDIDGVLNHRRVWHGRRERAAALDKPHAIAYASFDRVCVMRLNRILDETGAVCVLSSSWRRSFSLDEMRDMLAHNGFTGQLIGKTDYLQNSVRGEEIQKWLDECERDVERIVILDDEADMYPLIHRLVQTDFDNGGLLDEHVDRAVEMLEGSDQ